MVEILQRHIYRFSVLGLVGESTELRPPFHTVDTDALCHRTKLIAHARNGGGHLIEQKKGTQ